MKAESSVVAVVDDDPRVLESLVNLLESAGYIAWTFPSAETLLECGLERVSLLITDIGLPGMDGFALGNLVKAAQPDLPIFLITGRHELAELEQGRKIGGFFHKPFDAAALLSAVGEALDDR